MKRMCYTSDDGLEKCIDANRLTIRSTCQFVPSKNPSITKRQTAIIFLSMLGIAIAFGGMHLFTALDTPFSQSSLNLGQYETQIAMEYHDGVMGHPTTSLLIDIVPDRDHDVSNYTITIGASVYTFQCNYTTGYVKDTTRYPFFWVYLENNLLYGHIEDGTEIPVCDPVGLLGAVDAEYTILSQQKLVYWTDDPGMTGSQLSFKFVLYDAMGNAQAIGIMDVTSGLLMTLDGQISLKTIDPGTFPISRHRYTGFPIVIASIILIPLIAFLWKRDSELTILLFLGTFCVAVDVYFDVWMVGLFGMWGLLALHLTGIVLLYFLGFVRYRVGGHWIMPAIVEMAFIFFFNLYTGEGSIVPYISVGMGLLFGFILLTVHVFLGRKDQFIRYDCHELPSPSP